MNYKIINKDQIKLIADKLRKQRKCVITTNDTFDIIHAGHIQFLEQGKALGDVLIIGLNSDESVKKYKGDKRPINSQNDRSIVLSALNCVDYIVIFDEPEPSLLLEYIKPNIHVKAGDYTIDPSKENSSNKVWEREIVEKNGGQVKILPLLNGRSTTSIIQKIVETYKNETNYKECKHRNTK